MAGLSGLSEVFTFKTDATAPHISLTDWWYIWESGEFVIHDYGSKIVLLGYEIRDPQNRWKKVERSWTPNTEEFAYAIAWNRVFADGVVAPIGSYNVTVYAVDDAGNRTERTARIIIPAPNATPIPTSTPMPTATASPSPTPTQAGGTVPMMPTMTPTPTYAPSPTPTASQSGGIFGFGSEADSTTPDSNSPTSNILWGAAAAAALGVFSAKAAERKKARDARRAAAARAAKHRAELQAIWNANGAAMYEAKKAAEEQARIARKQALQEKALRAKEKLLELKDLPKMKQGNPFKMASPTQQGGGGDKLDSATRHYIAMGRAFEADEELKKQYYASRGWPMTKSSSEYAVTLTPSVMQNILVKICGSQGAFGIQHVGPICLDDGTLFTDDGKIPQMTAWNPSTFPGYIIYPSQYPGYQKVNGIEITGKAIQAVQLYNELKNYKHVILAGYSSGVHSGLFTAEMRMADGLTSDLILVGPPIADPNYPVFAIDPNGIELTEETFITRVQNLAHQGNHVLVIDDNGTGYYKYREGFTNCGEACNNISYLPYNPGGEHPHELIDDLPIVADISYNWINNEYSLP